MLLEPKSVPPGYLKRWALQAATLVGANFHLWLLLMIIPAGAACLLEQSALASLLIFALGFFTLLLSTELAVAAEHAPVKLSQVPGMLLAAWREAGNELWRQRKELALTFLVVLALVWLFASFGPSNNSSPAAPEPDLDRGILFLIFSVKSPLVNSGVLLLCGIWGLRRSAVLGYLVHPLKRMHGLSSEAAEALVAQAVRTNMSTALMLDAVVCGSALGAVVLYPGFALLLLCFLPAMSYVACREMFGPGAKPITAAKPAATAIPGTGWA